MSRNKNLKGAGGGSKQPAARTNTSDNLFSRDKVELVLALCEGPIQGLATPDGLDPVVGDDFRSFLVGDVPLRNRENQDNFKDLDAILYTGEDTPSVIDLSASGGQGNTTDVGVVVTKENPVKRVTPAELRGRIKAIEVRLVITQLYYENDSGVFNHQLVYQIEYKKSKAPDTTYINYEGDDYNPSYGTLVKVGKTTSGWIHDYRLELPEVDPDPNDDWEIRITKHNPDYIGGTSTEKLLSEFSWESYQCMTGNTLQHANLAMVHVSGKSSDQFSSIPDFSGVYDTKLIQVPVNYDPTQVGTAAFDGAWTGAFKQAWSNNPAWVFYDLVMNPRYGLRAHSPMVTIDTTDVYRAGLYCNESVVTSRGEVQKRYTFNGVLSENQSARDVLDYLAGSFDAVWYDDGNGRISLKVDIWQEPTLLLTPECITPEGFQYSFSDTSTRYNDITVSFINPDLGWVEDRRKVPSETDPYGIELRAKNGRVPLDFVAIGCTNEDEAIRRALWRLIVANTEVTTVTFNIPRLGSLFEPFEIVYVADPNMLWTTYTGRVEKVQGDLIFLRDPLPLEFGVDHLLQLQTYAGLQQLTVRGNANPATILTNQAGVIDPSPAFAQFAILTDDYPLKPFRILAVEDSESEGELMRVTAIEVSKDKYTHDLLVVNNRYVLPFPKATIFNVDLYNEFYSRYGSPRQGMVIEFLVPDGCLICSSTTAKPAVTTGRWPNGVTPKLRMAGGMIAGLGGKGGRGGRAFFGWISNKANTGLDRVLYYGKGEAGAPGGPALFVLSPIVISLEAASSPIAGGAGGGGGSGGVLAHLAAPFVSQRYVAYPGAGGAGGAPFGQGGLVGKMNADSYTNYAYHDTFPVDNPGISGGAGTDATATLPGAPGPGVVDVDNLGGFAYQATVGAAGGAGDLLTGGGAGHPAQDSRFTPTAGVPLVTMRYGEHGRGGARGLAIRGRDKVIFEGGMSQQVIGQTTP